MVLPFLIPVAATIAAEVLPSLVNKLAGDRAGNVAEEVVNVAAAVAGVPESRDPQEILERLRTDAKAEAELRIRLAEIENREEERILEDRLSAREMSRERTRAGVGNARANVMLVLAFAGLVACVGVVVFPPKQLGPPEIGLITTVAGVLLKMVSDAFAFEFGSSQGSKTKDEQISRFQDQLTAVSRERSADAERQARVVRDVAERARESVVEVARVSRPADFVPAGVGVGASLTFAQRLRSGQL